MWHTIHEDACLSYIPLTTRPNGGDKASTGVMKRGLRAEDPGGLVKNREHYSCQ